MMNLINALTSNRGFSNVSVNGEQIEKDELTRWHGVLDALHSCAYTIASCRYNGKDSGNASNRVFSLMSELYAMVGKLDNGATLRSDIATANTIVSFATVNKAVKSPALQYQLSKKSNATRTLNALLETKGANQGAIKALELEIKEAEKQIEELKKADFNLYKRVSKSSAKSFYKSVEDFIADMILNRSILSEAEVQAEKKALNAARKARRKANK